MCSNGACNIEHGNVLSLSGTCFKVHWNTFYMYASTCEHISQMPCGCQICDVLSPCQQGAKNNGTC